LKKNIKISEHPILLLYYFFCLSLRTFEESVAISFYFISFIFFAFVLFLPILIAHAITIRYSYALIYILRLTTNSFPLHLCHSRESGNPSISFSVIASPDLSGRGNLIFLYISIFYVFSIKIL
jgi:hypothetical protein